MPTVPKRDKPFSLQVGAAAATSASSEMGDKFDAFFDAAKERIRDNANLSLKAKI